MIDCVDYLHDHPHFPPSWEYAHADASPLDLVPIVSVATRQRRGIQEHESDIRTCWASHDEHLESDPGAVIRGGPSRHGEACQRTICPDQGSDGAKRWQTQILVA